MSQNPKKASVRIGSEMPVSVDPSNPYTDRMVKGEGEDVNFATLPSVKVGPSMVASAPVVQDSAPSAPAPSVEEVQSVSQVDAFGNLVTTITSVHTVAPETVEQQEARVKDSKTDQWGNRIDTY